MVRGGQRSHSLSNPTARRPTQRLTMLPNLLYLTGKVADPWSDA